MLFDQEDTTPKLNITPGEMRRVMGAFWHSLGLLMEKIRTATTMSLDRWEFNHQLVIGWTAYISDLLSLVIRAKLYEAKLHNQVLVSVNTSVCQYWCSSVSVSVSTGVCQYW